MKLIVKKNKELSKKMYIKNSLRNVFVLFLYIFGFSAYAMLYIGWTLSFKDIKNISWISIPIIGFLYGIINIIYIYTGSLFCKGLTMISIMLYVFIFPFIIAIIN